MTQNPVYRILDASANRAAEGLRTMEEIARFALDDGDLTAEFKNQRHGLVSALKRVSRHSLLRAVILVRTLGRKSPKHWSTYVRTWLMLLPRQPPVLSNRSGSWKSMPKH